MSSHEIDTCVVDFCYQCKAPITQYCYYCMDEKHCSFSCSEETYKNGKKQKNCDLEYLQYPNEGHYLSIDTLKPQPQPQPQPQRSMKITIMNALRSFWNEITKDLDDDDDDDDDNNNENKK